MKLAVNRYSVIITRVSTGKEMCESYYGYKTRKEAEARAEAWNKIADTIARVEDNKIKKTEPKG
jgi:hypothetical protein